MLPLLECYYHETKKERKQQEKNRDGYRCRTYSNRNATRDFRPLVKKQTLQFVRGGGKDPLEKQRISSRSDCWTFETYKTPDIELVIQAKAQIWFTKNERMLNDSRWAKLAVKGARRIPAGVMISNEENGNACCQRRKLHVGSSNDFLSSLLDFLCLVRARLVAQRDLD